MLGLPPFTALESSDFPGPFKVQFLLPFLHCVSVVTANAGAAVATSIMAAIRAAAINKLVRLITLFLSLPHPPNGLALKPSQVGCEFAGAGRVVCASTSSYKQASCPLPVHEYFVSPNLGSSLPSPSRSPFSQKTKPATGPLVPCSRLHHWLPLSLVPIFTGQSS